MSRRTSLNIDASVFEALAALAASERRSMTAVVEAAIMAYAARTRTPARVLGYVKLDLGGDINAAALTCVECHLPVGDDGTWVGVMDQGGEIGLHGPLCRLCAMGD